VKTVFARQVARTRPEVEDAKLPEKKQLLESTGTTNERQGLAR
jgi:hypothetical protein